MSFLFQLPTTLPETNIASENRWLEDDSILPGFHFFNCELLDSGRESTILNRRNIPTKLGKEFSTQQHPPPPPPKKIQKTPFHLSLGPTSKQKKHLEFFNLRLTKAFLNVRSDFFPASMGYGTQTWCWSNPWVNRPKYPKAALLSVGTLFKTQFRMACVHRLCSYFRCLCLYQLYFTGKELLVWH